MIVCAYLSTIQVGETLFDCQTRWLGHVLLAEARPSPEGEERNLVTVVEYEGRLGHFTGDKSGLSRLQYGLSVEPGTGIIKDHDGIASVRSLSPRPQP